MACVLSDCRVHEHHCAAPVEDRDMPLACDGQSQSYVSDLHHLWISEKNGTEKFANRVDQSGRECNGRTRN
jgi:hypothetical protein